MKNKLLKMLVVGLAVCSLLSMSGMITQDAGAAFGTEVNKLIASGVSKEEIEDYLRNNGYANDIVGGTQALKEAEASGYFENKKNSSPAATTAPETATPTPKPTPAPHEHKYNTKLTKRSTCSEDGVLTYTCECGDTYEEPVAKTEHKYVETVTKEPTCTTAGEKTFTCSLCGDSYTELIEAKGHTDGPFETTKEATCTEDGERTVYCKECGAVLRTEVIPATGHENTGTVTNLGGFFTPGTEEVRCLKCLAVLDEKPLPAPISHWIVTIAAGIIIFIFLLGGVLVLFDKIKAKKNRKK